MNIHNLNRLYQNVHSVVSGQSVNSEEKFSNDDNFAKTLFVHLQCDRSVWVNIYLNNHKFLLIKVE